MAELTDVFASLDGLDATVEQLSAQLDVCDDATLALGLARLAGLRCRLEAVWLQAVGRAADAGHGPRGSGTLPPGWRRWPENGGGRPDATSSSLFS